ncbi:MAG: STAS domain-containing protein [Polyangiaceae bacterium]|nr:STAS domain-containing protein [Polyangiaceae bacterium]
MSEAELAAVEAEIATVEAAIAETDALLDVVFEHSPHGIFIARTDGTVRVNPAGTRAFEAHQDAKTEAKAQRFGFFADGGGAFVAHEQLPLSRALVGETIESMPVRMRGRSSADEVLFDVTARPLADGSAVAIFRDMTREREARQKLAARSEQIRAREAENRALLERLRMTLDALSTPVLEVGPGILAVPVIGIVDTQRGAAMSEKILGEVVRTQATHVVIDLTGVAVIDTSTADRLLKLGSSLRLLGSECIVSGIQPAVAQTLVAIGVDIGVMVPRRDLQHALDYCIKSKRAAAAPANGGAAAPAG